MQCIDLPAAGFALPPCWVPHLQANRCMPFQVQAPPPEAAAEAEGRPMDEKDAAAEAMLRQAAEAAAAKQSRAAIPVQQDYFMPSDEAGAREAGNAEVDPGSDVGLGSSSDEEVSWAE